MNNSSKQFIDGTQITKEKAYQGLGDPKIWDKQAKELKKKFKARPKKRK